MRKLLSVSIGSLVLLASCIKEYHVSIKGNDRNPGTLKQPFRTISAAARIAGPGDVITVYQGIYREQVNPPRGGISDKRRIIYQAAKGEKPEIRGSERIANWTLIRNTVWKAILPNSFFKEYNPYQDTIYGDWFFDQGRKHHTGEVYLNGRSLYEMDSLNKVMNPVPIRTQRDPEGTDNFWFCESTDKETIIYANFKGYDPNQELVEINVRETCFYPEKPGIDHITVRGFRMSQAATQWAPPTAEQIGLIGTNWSMGWVIEDNEISDSKCAGITLGKDRKTGHNPCVNNPDIPGEVLYNQVIDKALLAGWSRNHVGSHLVRNNIVHDCEQAGICGSLGAVFSRINGNWVYDIWTKRLFSGAEIAGIKIHAAIDVILENNLVQNAGKGLWLDWMAQGTRVSRNVLFGNAQDDLFFEVNHGPYLVDNNLILSENGIRDDSQGGAYVHNLVCGKVVISKQDPRKTPYHHAHSTTKAGLADIRSGDCRFFNNIFVQGFANFPNRKDTSSVERAGYGLEVCNNTLLPVYINGNVYYNGAVRYALEDDFLEEPVFNPRASIRKEGSAVYLTLTYSQSVPNLDLQHITSTLLGTAIVPGLPFENPDGTPVVLNTDFFGNTRIRKSPTPGPFEITEGGTMQVKVWEYKP